MSHVVLVVDDDADVLDVVTSMLQELGCDVVSARNGAEALDHLARNERISILITDINMPGMDGHELAERARRVRPGLRVLQLSGREPRRGGLPMIRKPFSLEDLANTMKQTTGAC
ncbi:response regulator [Bradyrhizobium guangzhouense]|uniref:response regulator n=1 Tax=Bradyrhizobium guangzhouense TaxID=1325095 RepID=UPI001009E65A|nr:response regulator [Bradyrhizobium guangzhouense]RXH19500.1 response regulator [Bradyrhizobium guangzhouense]